MKNMVAKSPLATTKKLPNHSARRTLIKTLKKKQVPKCDIITITGHTTEAGLDAYDSGDEAQQEAISLAIDNIDVPINRNAMSTTNNTTTKNILNQSQFFISPDDPRLKNPCFNFFSPQNSFHSATYPHASIPFPSVVSPPTSGFNFSFNNCTVNFTGIPGPSSSSNQPDIKIVPPKRRRYVIYSSDSSQES